MASRIFSRFPWISRLLMAALIGSLRYLRALWLVRCEHFSFGFTTLIISCLFSLQSCDFYFDNPKEANERGFNFEPLKVRVFWIVFSFILCLVFHSLFSMQSFLGEIAWRGLGLVQFVFVPHFRRVLILAWKRTSCFDGNLLQAMT